MLILTVLLFILAVLSVPTANAEPQQLTLEQCRKLALANNHSAQISEEAQAVCELQRKAALAAMFPKAGLNASYIYSSNTLILMNDQKDFTFGQYHTADDGSHSFTFNDEWWSANSPMNNVYLDENAFTTTAGKEIAGAVNGRLGQLDENMKTTLASYFNDIYGNLRDELTFDNHGYFIGQVGITQPIYVGGRLRELYNISKSAERAAGIREEQEKEDLILSVDEAYWRVVSVAEKAELANNYYNLLVKLEGDVQEAVNEGLYTQSDLLKVKVKRGEAEVKRMQATNGLVLSKMALCQLIGLPLESQIECDAFGLKTLSLQSANAYNMASVVESRAEIQLLEEAEKVAKSGVRMAAASLQPNIVASANYVYTNPNLENGFRTDWSSKGFFTAGVVMNVPIAHADDIYRLKAAKHTARMASLKLEEAKEMITLQTTQAGQKLLEAQQKEQMTALQLTNAEEVLRLARESFDAGMIPLGDLMQAQTGWLSASSDHLDAEVDAKMAETYFLKYTRQLQY